VSAAVERPDEFRAATRAWLEANCPPSMRTPMPEDEIVWGGRNARFKCPRLIRFVGALPRNATGKIHKPTLRKDFSVPAATDVARTKAS